MRLSTFFTLSALVVVAYFAASSAQAQHVPGTPFIPLPMDYFETAGRVKVTQPIAGLTLPGGQRLFDTANVAPVGGNIESSSAGQIKNPSGNRVPVSVKAKIPSAAAARAIGKFAGKVLPGVGYALAIKELAEELGFGIDRDSAGNPIVTKPDPAVCSVAPCYSWQALNNNGSLLATFPSFSQACAYIVAYHNQGGSCVITEEGSNFHLITSAGTYYYGAGHRAELIAPSPAVSRPSTLQELEDAIASNSGWPTSSAIARALAESLPPGSPAPVVDPPSVSGPATSPGTTSTTTKPNGDSQTTTVTHNHTYAGNTINTTTTTVINNYNAAANTTTTETTESVPAAPPSEPDYSVSDTALPDQPKLYEPKYPQGLTGVWAQKKAELVATPLASLVSQLMPSVGSGGTCPAWNLNLALGAWDYGTHNVAPPCYIWDWCKFFIIAGALLLARALIFGG